MERVRLSQRYRFPYRHRDPRKLIERFHLEVPVPGPPRKPRPILGTETLLHRFTWLETTRRAVEHQQQELDEFLSKRIRLKTENESFWAAGGGQCLRALDSESGKLLSRQRFDVRAYPCVENQIDRVEIFQALDDHRLRSGFRAWRVDFAASDAVRFTAPQAVGRFILRYVQNKYPGGYPCTSHLHRDQSGRALACLTLSGELHFERRCDSLAESLHRGLGDLLPRAVNQRSIRQYPDDLRHHRHPMQGTAQRQRHSTGLQLRRKRWYRDDRTD